MKPHVRQKLVVLLPLPFLLSSCMLAFNSSTHKVHIATDSKNDNIRVNGQSHRLRNGAVTVDVAREKQPLALETGSGDSTYKAEIKSRNSFNYIFDAITTAGVSVLVQKDRPKRYFHQRYIYLRQKDNNLEVSRFAPNRKGLVNAALSIPYANSLYTKTTSSYHHSAGFLGISAGVEYFYRENSYLSLQAGGATDFLAPFPAPVRIEGLYERSSLFFINARHNHTVGSFDLGYGIGFSRYTWRISDNKDPNFVPSDLSNSALGFCVAAQYRFTRNFYAGVLYQPTVLNMSGERFGYQHLLSAEMTFKFPARRAR